jgi:hypothetical protein
MVNSDNQYQDNLDILQTMIDKYVDSHTIIICGDVNGSLSNERNNSHDAKLKFYTHHRIPNKHMTTINFEVIYVIKTVMKYYLKKIDASFHQRFPNMVQRLFADTLYISSIVTNNYCII